MRLRSITATIEAYRKVLAIAFCSSNAMMSPASRMFLYSTSCSVGAIRTDPCASRTSLPRLFDNAVLRRPPRDQEKDVRDSEVYETRRIAK